MPGGSGRRAVGRCAKDLLWRRNADAAFDRLDKASIILKKPVKDGSDSLGNATEVLTAIELAAKSFECAAVTIGAGENFPIDQSNEL